MWKILQFNYNECPFQSSNGSVVGKGAYVTVVKVNCSSSSGSEAEEEAETAVDDPVQHREHLRIRC